MTALKVELRRGPGLSAAPVLALLGLFAAVDTTDSWTLWANFSQGIAGAIKLMGPAAAAVAAAAGLRSGRHATRTAELLSARGPQSVILAELGALLAWTLAALTVVAAAVGTVTALHAVWGRPSFAWLLETFVALAAYVVVGYVAGRLLPIILTPLLAAGLLYLLGALLLSRPDRWWYFLSPLDVQLWLPFDSVNTRNLLLQTLWLSGLCVAVTALAFLRARTGHRPVAVWAAGGGVLALTAVVVLQTAGGGFWTINTQIRWTCAGAEPQVCLHPAFADSRSALDGEFRSVYQRLSGTPFAFTRIEQRPRGIGSRTDSPSTVAFALDDPVQADYPDAVVDVAANALTGGNQCAPEPGRPAPEISGAALEQVLVAWAADSLGVISSGDAAATAATTFDALSAPAQKAWLAAHADAVRRCTLTDADFR